MDSIYIIADLFKNKKLYILKSLAVIVSRVTQSKFNYFLDLRSKMTANLTHLAVFHLRIIVSDILK